MRTLILLGIVTIVCFVVGIILDRKTYLDYLPGLLAFTGCLTGACLILSLVLLINKEYRFQETINDYEFTSQLVETYTDGDYGNRSALMEQVIVVNKRIASHKAYYQSPWTGLWHSEEIANLEPIKFDMKTQKLE